MLLSLELTNFRKIRSRTFEFSEGLNGVFGENYRGKTTILLAIAVALAGPSYARGKNLVTRGEVNFKLNLKFEIRGGIYEVVRAKNSAKLFSPAGELLATQHGNVNVAIGRLIGMPINQWLELRFVQQKNAAQMFEAGASKLNTLIESVTGVKILSKVIELLGEINKKAAYAFETTKSLVMREDVYQETISIKDNAIQMEKNNILEKEKLVLEQTALSVQLSEVKNCRIRLAEEVKHALAVKQAAAAAKVNFETAQTNLTQSAVALESTGAPSKEWALKLQSLKDQEQDLNIKRNKLADLLSNFQQATRAHEKQQAKVTQAETVLSSLKLEDMSKESQTLMELSKMHQESLMSFREAKTRLNTELEEAKSLLSSGVCPECKRAYDLESEQHSHNLQQAETRIQQWPSLIKINQESITNLEAKIREVSLELNKSSQLIFDYQAKEKELDKLKQELPDLVLALNHAKKALEEMQTPFDFNLAEIDNILKDLVRQQKTIQQNLDKEIAAEAVCQAAQVSYDKAKRQLELATAEDSYGDISEKETLLRQYQDREITLEAGQRHNCDILERLQQRAKDIANVLATSSAALSRHEESKATVERLQIRMQGSEQLQQFLRQNRSRYVQSAWTTVLARAAAFAQGVTGGVISDLRRTEAGDFEFIEAGEVASVSDASGAQGAILGLAIQIALAETLPTYLDVFVCDEPTADMDAAHSSASLLALSAVSRQGVVVSHHRMDETICNQVIEL